MACERGSTRIRKDSDALDMNREHAYKGFSSPEQRIVV